MVRLRIRFTVEELMLLERAAETLAMSVPEFIVASAVSKAKTIERSDAETRKNG